MVRKLKYTLYFLVAGYFRHFARIQLLRWDPCIVVVTGSNGKTTALNLIEVQLGRAARYSHGANSSFGIPFDILGLRRRSYSPFEWIMLILMAPLRAWKQSPQERIYVVEADCDRPGEGVFLSSLLRPEVTVWLSSSRTHTVNFEKVCSERMPIEQQIAHEFGSFAEHTSKLLIINADEPLIVTEAKRAHAQIHALYKREELERYELGIGGTEFLIRGKKYHAPLLLPEETLYAIAASTKIAEYFEKPPTSDIWRLTMPPGRSSIFKGIKTTTLIDSSYNTNAASVSAIVRMVEKFPSPTKWLVLGDLTEQGSHEKEEHEKVAELVAHADFKKIILVGPRLKAHALPILKDAVSFDGPREALDYIRSSLVGGETIVFKGARFLEGIIEHLLENKSDAGKLCRREAVWQKRRTQWGL